LKTYQNKQSFSLIEFIFIILIIAIISSIAISKISKSDIKTSLQSCKNDFNIINLAIKNKLQNNNFKNINNDFYLEDNNILFSNILNNFNSSSWIKKSTDTYNCILNNQQYIEFTYNHDTNIFICNKTEDLCKEVLN
jgi:general secretion pathway protein G